MSFREAASPLHVSIDTHQQSCVCCCSEFAWSLFSVIPPSCIPGIQALCTQHHGFFVSYLGCGGQAFEYCFSSCSQIRWNAQVLHILVSWALFPTAQTSLLVMWDALLYWKFILRNCSGIEMTTSISHKCMAHVYSSFCRICSVVHLTNIGHWGNGGHVRASFVQVECMAGA